MASFQAKIEWERQRERENNKNRCDVFLANPKWKIKQKYQKNQKKNTIITSFQAKIGWERPRNRKNNKNRFDGFLPDTE